MPRDGRTAVVNIRNGGGCDVYIGRPSPFGNPFPLKSEDERQAVLDLYRQWLRNRLEADAHFKSQVLALRGKVLGCYCAPKPCHGDVLIEVIERLEEK